MSEDITGMSPPSVFIGRIGYPNVYAGPLVPPIHEDTGIYDLPEHWFGKSMDEIVGFRSLLVRGKHRVNVQKFMDAGKILDQTRELALADSCVDIELNLTKKPRGSIFLDDDIQPFGPSAPIRDLHVGNARYDDKIEKAYYDTDLRATNAVLDLYSRGVIGIENSESLQRRCFRSGKKQTASSDSLEHNSSRRHHLEKSQGKSKNFSRNQRIQRFTSQFIWIMFLKF